MEIKLAESLKRHLLGKEIKFVANQCSIPESTLHGWINDVKPNLNSLSSLYKLASFLDISIEELLFDKKSEFSKNVIVSCSFFEDSNNKYKITIEKLNS